MSVMMTTMNSRKLTTTCSRILQFSWSGDQVQ